MEVALMSRPTEFKAGLPEDFSEKNDDATRWLLAMKSYFVINTGIYMDDTTTILIFLKKLSKGRGATFAEGWYMKLANLVIPVMVQGSDIIFSIVSLLLLSIDSPFMFTISIMFLNDTFRYTVW